jgi:phosphoglycerate kinase
MPSFKTIDDFPVQGKRVILRADLNVPMRDGKVGDLTRLERLAPTIRELSQKGARVIVISHFDRPKGKVVPSMSLAPLAAALGQVLGGAKVAFAGDCVGAKAEAAVACLKNGEIALLENLRFHGAEGRTSRASPSSSPRWAIFTSTTPSPAPIAPMPRPRRSRGCCRRRPAG